MTERKQPQTRNQVGLETRRRILAAAFEIASERGYDGTTLSLVTTRAGLKPGSVYWQFRSKDEILAEVIDASYERWREDMDRAEDEWRRTEPALAAGMDSPDAATRIHSAARYLAHQLSAGILGRPAFWSLGLMLALERRLVEATARQRFRALRARTTARMAARMCAVLPDDVLAAHPHVGTDVAQLVMTWSDGLLIAQQTDDPFDVYPSLDLLASGIEAALLHVVQSSSG